MYTSVFRYFKLKKRLRERGKNGGQFFILGKCVDIANAPSWQEHWESNIREPITTSSADGFGITGKEALVQWVKDEVLSGIKGVEREQPALRELGKVFDAEALNGHVIRLIGEKRVEPYPSIAFGEGGCCGEGELKSPLYPIIWQFQLQD